MCENDDQQDIIRSIKAEGGYAKKWATLYTVGVPDLICALPGIGLFLMEVKTPGGKVSPKQQYEQEQFTKAGGLVLLGIVNRKKRLNLHPPNRSDMFIPCHWLASKKIYMSVLRGVQELLWAMEGIRNGK